jgi:hypothetical protein
MSVQPPYSRAEAKKVARKAVESGYVTYVEPHAKDRMRERNVSMLDVENVLRAGFLHEGDPEFVNGSWRYRICSNKLTVVVAFSGERVVVITCIKEKNRK